MRINVVQNQGYSHAFRMSNANKIAFQGFNVQDVRRDIFRSLKDDTDNINTVEEVYNKIAEAERILKILKPFDKTKFDLNGYRTRFSGNKQVAFDELLERLGEDAKDLPVTIKRGGITLHGLTYLFPKGSGISNIFHFGVSNHGKYLSTVKYGTRDKIELSKRPELWKMVGASDYFYDYPKSIDAIKEFLINCIDELVLTPRAEELDKQEANKLAKAAAERLRNANKY